MVTEADIRKTLRDLTSDFVAREINTEVDESYALQQIASESMQAIEYIILLESEFEMEFDDNDVNVEFFSNLDNIATLIAEQSKIPSCPDQRVPCNP